MKDLTGDVLRQLHKHPFGPCPAPDETAAVLQKAMKEFEIDTLNRVACFIGQLSLESNEFSQMVEDGNGQEYENRHDLGNVSPGDGPRFKGRGYIQLTGRHNYAMFGNALQLDLIGKPDLATVPEIGARIAGRYWLTRGLNLFADEYNIKQITKLINGGYTDLDKREWYTNKCKELLA
jgi:putative chitinase